MSAVHAELGAQPDFATELAVITSRPLTADIIDTYADTALDNLADLIQRVVDNYHPERSMATAKELEDAAFRRFGLNQVEETLDHIAAKSAEIQKLDHIIAAADITSQVIVPPDETDQTAPDEEPGESDRGFDKETVPRLKTLLFILANDFDIDLDDPDQLTLVKGSIKRDMVRRKSYYLVEAPRIQRTVLICDEVGNATFVLDGESLKKNQIDNAELMSLTKEELRILLEADRSLGQRIVYRSDFVPELITALADPSGTADSVPIAVESAGRYLAPKAPEGVVSLSGLVKVLAVDRRTAERAIASLEDELGDIHSFSFKGRVVPGYDPEQTEMIRERLRKGGHYDWAPEGFVNKNGLSRSLGVAVSVIDKAIEAIGEELGDIRAYKKSSARPTPHFSPEQMDMIRTRLEESGSLVDKAPEDFLSVRLMADEFGVGQHTVERAIKELGKDLGETSKYRFYSQSANGYSPEQQSMVLNQLHFQGLFDEAAPEGFLQEAGIAEDLGLSPSFIHKIVMELGEELGDVENYRSHSRRRSDPHYSPEQIALIRQRIEAEGHLNNDAPEDYMTIGSLAKSLGVAHTTVSKSVSELEAELGDVDTYKFRGGVYPGYSPEQQDIIAQRVIERML